MRAFKNLKYIHLAWSASRFLTGSVFLIRVCKALMTALQTLAIAGLVD
jgi:hypothetical protein